MVPCFGIKACVSKENCVICWIVRNFVINREKVVMIATYNKALIRPHLGCPIVESTCSSWKLEDCFGAGERPEAVYPSD